MDHGPSNSESLRKSLLSMSHMTSQMVRSARNNILTTQEIFPSYYISSTGGGGGGGGGGGTYYLNSSIRYQNIRKSLVR